MKLGRSGVARLAGGVLNCRQGFQPSCPHRPWERWSAVGRRLFFARLPKKMFNLAPAFCYPSMVGLAVSLRILISPAL